MEECNPRKNKKKEEFKVKIFTVPSTLEDSRNKDYPSENFNESTKEKIVNKAFTFHSKGNILEAERYYR